MEMTMKEQMLAYLQAMMDKFKADEERYGLEDHFVRRYLDEMIACKEMVEALIGEPVNLGLNGIVTVGF